MEMGPSAKRGHEGWAPLGRTGVPTRRGGVTRHTWRKATQEPLSAYPGSSPDTGLRPRQPPELRKRGVCRPSPTVRGTQLRQPEKAEADGGRSGAQEAGRTRQSLRAEEGGWQRLGSGGREAGQWGRPGLHTLLQHARTLGVTVQACNPPRMRTVAARSLFSC